MICCHSRYIFGLHDEWRDYINNKLSPIWISISSSEHDFKFNYFDIWAWCSLAAAVQFTKLKYVLNDPVTSLIQKSKNGKPKLYCNQDQIYTYLLITKWHLWTSISAIYCLLSYACQFHISHLPLSYLICMFSAHATSDLHSINRFPVLDYLL